ncbi:MAG: molybdenum cofactor guanylyltransferase [Anaerolineales bacterium]|nr:molybdenum cofactor guanylyltransferase [Anaerolineales bacterium]
MAGRSIASRFLTMITGVILAGGKSRRMGRNKAFLDLGGRPMIEVVVEKVRAVAGEVIIVADDVKRYVPFADLCVTDRFAGIGTLGGIHSGLLSARTELALIVGCDMPFLNPAVLTWFIQAARGYDVVILKQGEWVEPLHGVYHKNCLPEIERAIRAGKHRVISFFDSVRVRTVSAQEIEHLDPGLASFRNINSPDEWKAARSLFQ